MEPIDAVPIALDPLDREPTLLSRSTQSCLFKINMEPIDAVPIALDPLDREPNIDIQSRVLPQNQSQLSQ